MQPEQYVLLDFVYAKSQELERELKPQVRTQKRLENPIARQYGALVRRQPEIIEAIHQPSKLATDSGIYRLG